MLINDLYTNKTPAVAENALNEFAPSDGGGDSGNYFQALASAWYNGTFDSGSLEKGIKSQQDVERLVQRGVVCPDGVTRKFGIDYNSNFDGVVISSDDYYEHADHDETDSRTGKPFGPYDYMEFGDDDLDESAQWRDPQYKGQLYTQEKPDYNDTREYDRARWDPKPKGYQGRKEPIAGGEFPRTDPLKRGQGIGRSGIEHNINLSGKRKGLPSRDQITSLKGSIKDAHGRHTRANLPEGMEGQVVFSGTGDNGGKYEIIQSGATDYMIHANGRHIDTYGSLQRAMSVLKNEVPGLQQGVAEGLQQTLRKVVPGYAKREIDKKMDAEKFGRRDVDKDANFQRYKKIQDKLKEQGVAEAQTDYQKRRQRERDVDAGKPVKPEPRNPQNDYFARRKKEKEQGMAEGNPVAGQDFTMKDGAQMKWNPASKSWQQQAPVPGNDGFDVVSGSDTEHTIDTGNKSTGTYTSTDIFKNPNTGQQKSLATWDHTDPATGKNYSGSNDIDQYGNATTQKNYEESQDQLDELDKKTVASWVRQQPERIKGDTGLSRTNFKKAKRLVDKSIPSAIAKYKDPGYGKQEKRMDEVSLGKYREKATVDKALAQANKFFGRDDPAAVAAADRTIAKRERGLGRADARSRPYTAPPVDQDKQRRDLADKYPNIDELVRRAELRRDPQYDRADGQAYYNGRDAEQNYHKLKQIQRMIRGAELDEMDFGGVGQVTDSDTGDVTTNFSQGPLSVSQTKTPGGYTKQTDQQYNLGAATLGARTVGPNIGAGQLAGTTTKTATNNMTGQAKQQVKGVGFGGASGATVGKNYVGSSDDELSKYAADSATGINEEPDQVTVDVPGSSFTADKSTNTLSGTTNVHGVNINATKDMTPGGATTFSANMNVAPNLNIAATQKSADYNKGQLAGTKSVAAKYTDTTGALGQPGQQHTATRTAGVGFGGASGANVGKNYVDQYSVNESVDRIRHLAGIKPAR